MRYAVAVKKGSLVVEHVHRKTSAVTLLAVLTDSNYNSYCKGQLSVFQ